MPRFGVTIRVEASKRIEVEAEDRQAAEDMVWEEIGEDCENLDLDDLDNITNVDVRAYPTTLS